MHVGAGNQPADQRQGSGGMHHRRIATRNPVAEAHITRADMYRLVEQPLDIVEESIGARGRHAKRQRTVEIDATGIDLPAR